MYSVQVNHSRTQGESEMVYMNALVTVEPSEVCLTREWLSSHVTSSFMCSVSIKREERNSMILCMRPSATSASGLKLLVYEALSY